MPVAKTPNSKKYVNLIRKRLPEKKVRHCIFVAEFFSSYAEKIGVDHDKAVIAGLLHDLCRTWKKSELLHTAEDYGLEIGKEHEEHPILLHGPVAAEECRRELDIDDEEIYQAIYWHTTGAPGLGRLGQGLYVADFSEPMRKYPEAEQARTILRKENFDEALYYVAQSKVLFSERKSNNSPAAKRFLNWVEETYG